MTKRGAPSVDPRAAWTAFAALAASAAIHIGCMALLADVRVEDAGAPVFRARRSPSQSALPSGAIVPDAAPPAADSLPEYAPAPPSERLDSLPDSGSAASVPGAAEAPSADPFAEKARNDPEAALPAVSWELPSGIAGPDIPTPPRAQQAALPETEVAMPPPEDLALPAPPLPSMPAEMPAFRTLVEAAPARPGAAVAVSAIAHLPDPGLPPAGAEAAAALEALEKQAIAQGAPARRKPSGMVPFGAARALPEKVMPEVDEAAVEAEKDAVRALLENEKPGASISGAAVFSVKSGVCEDEPQWRYFELVMRPGMEDALEPSPKDFALIVDVSGSISGPGLEGLRAEAAAMLDGVLSPGDRFIVGEFASYCYYHSSTWNPADAANIRSAKAKIARLSAIDGVTTDVFTAISSVLRLPRDPSRPLVVVVVTDAWANSGTSDPVEVLGKFTRLNGGLVSVNIYAVGKRIDETLVTLLTDGNRGACEIYRPYDKRDYGRRLRRFASSFKNPLLSDIVFAFSASAGVEAYPAAPANLYEDGVVTVRGRCKASAPALAFTLRGLNRGEAKSGFFAVPFGADAPGEEAGRLRREWSFMKLHALEEECAVAPSPEKEEAVRRHSYEYILKRNGTK